MSKVLMIVAQEGFRDEELLVPKEMLEKEGHVVKVASSNRSKATGSMGMTILPDMAFFEANPEYFDCYVVVGGPGSPKLAETKEVVELIANAYKAGKIIAAICLGPMTLAAAGILSEKVATVYPSKNGLDALRAGGARYKAEPVIVSGKVITGDGPQSAGNFASEIIKMLKD
jgi:protease I